MRNKFFHLVATSAVAVALSASSAYAQKKYDTGASDTEIKIGQTIPLSGPASAYATIGKAQAAYIKMINDQGGVNGRKINLIQYDDAYSPPKAVEQVRSWSKATRCCSPSSPRHARERGGAEISQPKEGAAAVRRHRHIEVHRPEELSLDDGINPNYFVEGRIYGQYILRNIRRQDWRALSERRPRQGLPERHEGRPRRQGREDDRGEASYEVADPTIDSQILKLRMPAGAVLRRRRRSRRRRPSEDP